MARLPEGPETFFRLSPAEPGKALSFAVKRGDLLERADATFFSLSNWIGKSVFPITTIESHFYVRDGDHNRLPDDEITDESSGVRYLRAQDLKLGEIGRDDPVFVTRRYADTVARSHIRPGYLLFSIMASIGNSAIVPDDFPPATANRAVGILVPKTDDPELTRYFFYLFLTNLGTQLYARIKKGGLQQRTNLADVAKLEAPLPPPARRKELVSVMDSASAARILKQTEADRLLVSLDDLVLRAVGITPPPPPRSLFAVQCGDLVSALNPDRYRAMQMEKQLPFVGRVGDCGRFVDVRCSPDKEAPQELWDWIRIDDLPNHPWQVENVRTEPGANIHGAFFEVEENDILIARLGPTIQNAKFVLCPKPARRTVASAEFLVLRCHDGLRPAAVLWLLRTKLYRNIMYLRSRGGTPSRFRLDGGDLAEIPFPRLDERTQITIAAEVQRCHETSRRLRAEAEEGWEAAKRWLEEQLLRQGGS